MDTAKAVGFPIRKFSDQSLFANSPRLIAGYDVLHRLQLPRHPPDALFCLTILLSSFCVDRSGQREGYPNLSKPNMIFRRFEVELQRLSVLQLS